MNNIIKQIAIKEGVSEQEIRQKIQAFIDSASANPDPKVQEELKKIPHTGENYTIEDFLSYFVEKIKRNAAVYRSTN